MPSVKPQPLRHTGQRDAGSRPENPGDTAPSFHGAAKLGLGEPANFARRNRIHPLRAFVNGGHHRRRLFFQQGLPQFRLLRRRQLVDGLLDFGERAHGRKIARLPVKAQASCRYE